MSIRQIIFIIFFISGFSYMTHNVPAVGAVLFTLDLRACRQASVINKKRIVANRVLSAALLSVIH
jgi:hypothetical protein